MVPALPVGCTCFIRWLASWGVRDDVADAWQFLGNIMIALKLCLIVPAWKNIASWCCESFEFLRLLKFRIPKAFKVSSSKFQSFKSQVRKIKASNFKGFQSLECRRHFNILSVPFKFRISKALKVLNFKFAPQNCFLVASFKASRLKGFLASTHTLSKLNSHSSSIQVWLVVLEFQRLFKGSNFKGF